MSDRPAPPRSKGARIAPSILSADFTQLGQEVAAVETAGADWIHVDVMDGQFVPNITIGPLVVRAVGRASALPLDVHLMIEEPENFIDAFADAGASSIGIHVEACPHLHRGLQQIRKAGARACAVVNPATPAGALESVLDELDQVLVMTVNPGFGGQSFIHGALPKIETLRNWIENRGLDVDLEVDGGVNDETIAAAASAGADVFVAGTAVFGQTDYRAAIASLRRAADDAAG